MATIIMYTPHTGPDRQHFATGQSYAILRQISHIQIRISFNFFLITIILQWSLSSEKLRYEKEKR